MTVRIRDILAPLNAFSPETSVAAARQYFISSPDILAVPVVFDAVPLGLLRRGTFMELFSQFGDTPKLLRMPVSRVMDEDPILAEVSSPAAFIANKVAEQSNQASLSGVVAVDGGQYAGYVDASTLLSAVAKENTARAKAMKAAAAKLKRVDQDAQNMRREQARFMAFLGHEIRTPLTGILGVADLLGDQKLSPEARDFARTISESGQHLDRLLGDFLDLSRLEVGKLNLVPTTFRVTDFANETRMLWSARTQKKGIVLRVTTNNSAADRIEGDATRLRQILFNLVGNAMKFTDKGTVDVHFETRVLPGHRINLEMTVTDTGIGISDQDKARLFEAFEQATPQTAHRYGGTGLGLSIAKGIAEQMGGSIALQDNPEGGAIFSVTCPVLKAGPRLAVENKPCKRNGNFKLGRVLLVEDHDVSQLVISEALKGAGWKVDVVTTAEQGLRRAREVSYQAIVTDLHLGPASGIDIIRGIRGMPGPNEAVPILAVSADVSERRIAQCKAEGFDGFVEKPVRPRSLVATLADKIVAHEAAVQTKARRLQAI